MNKKVTPLVLATDYMYQLPSLKSSAAHVVSVLVANLVLLLSTWKISVLAVDYFFIPKDRS